jgi:hypothetical protein
MQPGGAGRHTDAPDCPPQSGEPGTVALEALLWSEPSAVGAPTASAATR